MRTLIITVLLLTLTTGVAMAQPLTININAIIQIESSGNPTAYNEKEIAIGLMQIRPCVVQEWNKAHPDDRHAIEDMFIPRLNVKVGTWYLEHRIPEMIRAYRRPDTIENRIIAWNAGIKYVKDHLEIPNSTRKYIARYLEGAI